ncbi:MAG: zinc ribbon domain-containing protein, partial [Niameybacter sp.]
VALGIVIYKDAKAHDMSGALWTAIAVLGPNFIGVIIYLIVRSNVEKKYNCSNCKAEVRADYNMCPSCQGVFEKVCHVCKRAVSGEVAYCPYCGTK